MEKHSFLHTVGLSLFLAMMSDLLMEEPLLSFWALAFLYLIILVLLVFSVEGKTEVAVSRESTDGSSFKGMALQRVGYSMQSLPFGKVELETRISTTLGTKRLEEAGPSDLHLLQPRCAQPMGSATSLSARSTTTVPASKKFYAVLRGRQPGIYLSWPKCKQQVDGYSGARYKDFHAREEAERFLGSREVYNVGL
jgi:hypothetical protein